MSSVHANSPAMASFGLWSRAPAVDNSDPFRDTTSRALERDELLSVLEALHRCPAADLQTKLHLGGHLHRMLVEGTSTSAPARAHSYRDDFREAGGFLVVIQLISTLDHKPDELDEKSHSELQIEIFKLALSILSASLVQHPLNIKAFESTIGWKSLSDAVELAANGAVPADHVFGSLIALAVADISTYAGRIVSTRRYLADQHSKITSKDVEEGKESASEDLMDERIKDQWTPVPRLHSRTLYVSCFNCFCRTIKERLSTRKVHRSCFASSYDSFRQAVATRLP